MKHQLSQRLSGRPFVTEPSGPAAAGDAPVSADADSADKVGASQSVFRIVNSLLGAGLLGMPFCYKECGLVLATLLVLLTLVASELSVHLLMVASQLASKKTYEDLAHHCFGRLGQRIVDMCVFIMNVGSLVAYLNILVSVGGQEGFMRLQSYVHGRVDCNAAGSPCSWHVVAHASPMRLQNCTIACLLVASMCMCACMQADTFSMVSHSIIPPGAEPSRSMLLAGVCVGTWGGFGGGGGRRGACCWQVCMRGHVG
jgi:hypothetical protein